VRIPSYDDLTPSIPDVSAGDVFASTRRLLPAPGPVAGGGAPDEDGPAGTALFACLRSTRLPSAILDVARDFSPRVQRHAADAVVLDVSGLGRLLGSPVRIGAELFKALSSQLSAVSRQLADSCQPTADSSGRVSIAPTQIATLLLTLGEAPLTVVTGNVAAALASLPLRILQQFMAEVHGVTVLRKLSRPAAAAALARSPWPAWPACEQAFDVLQRWGLTTLGEFAALPAADLSARMGQSGVALQQLARGRDPRPLVPDPDVPRFVERMELEWPIDALEPLSFVLARLLDPLAGALERADRAAAAIRLDLRLVDRSSHARVLQLPVALRDARVLRTLLRLDLESHPPSAAIDVVTIEIDPAPGRVIQYSLLERAMPSAETLAALTARLGALLGEGRCGTPALLDTHRPDAFEMHRFDAPAPDPRARSRGEAAPASGSEITPCIRRFRPPVAVRVRIERGRPLYVAVDRRGMPGGHVVQAAGPWRSSGAWWQHDEPWDRDEWDVELSEGSVCRLFRDRRAGGWFLDGVLD
jgi:protein ImuB